MRVENLMHTGNEIPRVEVPKGAVAAASLYSCVAMQWAMPGLIGALTASVARFVIESRFGHLHFRPDGTFWSILDEAALSR